MPRPQNYNSITIELQCHNRSTTISQPQNYNTTITEIQCHNNRTKIPPPHSCNTTNRLTIPQPQNYNTTNRPTIPQSQNYNGIKLPCHNHRTTMPQLQKYNTTTTKLQWSDHVPYPITYLCYRTVQPQNNKYSPRYLINKQVPVVPFLLSVEYVNIYYLV